jgi:hypothetical protein
MATSKIGLGLWLGAITVIWSLYPLLFSHARGVLIFSVLTAMCALLGWVTGLTSPVVWSASLGLCNLTLALVLTAHPPNLWAGLSAGIVVFALLDGTYRFTYITRCWLAPGVVATLLSPFVTISAVTMAVGMLLGLLLVALGQQPLVSSATGLLTVTGACLFVGFLAVFLLRTSR